MSTKRTPQPEPPRLHHALAVACFILSGVAGLIYEIAWIRKAALVFGSTTYALSTVLAVFFLGLAIGSYGFGRLSRRLSRPLRAFAALEIAVALLAGLTIPAFDLAESLFGSIYRAGWGEGVVLSLARVGLISIVLLPPTVLMGGTLPLFCRQYVLDRSRIAGSVGFLYGANTLGAAAGCLIAGFWLIPTFGVKGSILFAGLLNVAAGAIVGAMKIPRPQAGEEERLQARDTGPVRVWMPALFFLTGFAVLGYEVVWTRFLALLIPNTVHTYTLTLGVVLLGIVIGSLVASRFLDRSVARARALGVLQAGLGVSVIALMTLPPTSWQRFDSVHVMFALLLLPAVLSGASFPLMVRMVVTDPSFAGEGVGRSIAINTVGGIAGSLAVGFVILPGMGLEAAVRLTTGASLAIGTVSFLVLDRAGPLAMRVLAAALGVAVWLAIPTWTGARLPDDFLARGGGVLVDHHEGLESNLAVVEKDGTIQLEIDHWWQGSARKTHQVMAAHVPMLLHRSPKRVLVVGAGAGQTPERMLMYDLERLDCVDIEPAVFDIARRHFPSAWMDDPRVRLIRADGRNLIAHSNEMYDIVSLELGQVFRPGVAAFYTVDFYRQVRARLRPGGLVAQFVPVPFLTPDMQRGIVRTFLEVFPAGVLWYNTSELLLIGANAERMEIDRDRLRLLTENQRVHEDLRYSQWGGPPHWLNQPEAFLGGALAGARGLAAFAASGEIYRDDRPVFAYQASRLDTTAGSENERAFVEALRPHLQPAGTALAVTLESDEASRIARMQTLNLADIVAAAILREFDAVRGVWPPERLLPLAESARAANPENAIANRVTGQVLMFLMRFDEAELPLQRAVLFNESDERAQRALATVLHRLGREREAIPHYRASLALRSDAETSANLGLALLATGDTAEARTKFVEALRLDAGLASARQQLERLER